MIRVQGDVSFDEPNNVPHVVAFIAFIHHGDGHTFASCPPCTTDAVHVGLTDVGNFKIDHVADAFHVNAAGCDVRGDEHANFAFAKGVHGFFALRLTLVPVDGFSSDVVLLEVTDYLVGAVLGAGEHQGGFDFRAVQDLHEQIAFCPLTDKHHALVDSLCGTADARDFNPNWILEDRLGELHNAVWHGRAEKQTLSLFRKHRNDAFDVVDEAHVEHGVCLVQDQKLNPLQRQQSLVAQVQQTTRGGHQHIGAFSDLGHLFVLAHAAKNQCRPHLDVLGVGLDVVVDLGGQLACGC